MEFFKNIIRIALFPIAVCFDGEFYAEDGTLMFKFLNWLYGGDDEAVEEIHLP